MKIIIYSILSIFILCSCSYQRDKTQNINLHRASVTLDSLFKYYSITNSPLLLENYPSDDNYKAYYLVSDEQINTPNKYSYLWPYSGSFSAVNALYEVTKDSLYLDILNNRILVGLDEYLDIREPIGYASYINTEAQSDRFYDDNIWIGIDYTDLFSMTSKEDYLQKAKQIWDFVISGNDDVLGGGIYWCEETKNEKNTCSNAPAAVFAFKLFDVTQDSSYYAKGLELYQWTKENLQDPTDYLYLDNIKLNGQIDSTKYAYNSGQMIQASVQLYNITNDSNYLEEAKNIAESAYNFFFENYTPSNHKQFNILKKGNVWFSAVMLRGYIELYKADKNRKYIDCFKDNLNYAWDHARESNGLFNDDFAGQTKDDRKWVLTQAAMIEMYARIAAIDSY